MLYQKPELSYFGGPEVVCQRTQILACVKSGVAEAQTMVHCDVCNKQHNVVDMLVSSTDILLNLDHQYWLQDFL